MEEGRILLAEDDELLRDALARLLRSKGYAVTPVDDGMAALEELRGSQYDLILTDVMMPKMTGEELLDRLDDLPGDKPPVIMITAHETVESAIKGIKAGVSAYIRKPLNMAEIDAAVRSALERRRLDKDLKRYYEELDRKVEERTRELQLLNSFSALVNRSFGLGAILDDAVKCIVEFMCGDVAGIYLVEGDPPMLHLKAHVGISEEFRKTVEVMDLNEVYEGKAMKDNALIIDAASRVQESIRETILREGLTTGMNTPIKSGDRLLGIIRVASRSGRNFEETNLQILTSFANQIGVAIDRIGLYNEQKSLAEDLRRKVNQLEMRTRELQLHNSFSALVNRSLDMETVLEAAVENLTTSLGTDAAWIYLMEGEPPVLKLKASKGFSERLQNAAYMVNPDEGYSGTTFRDGGAFIYNDISSAQVPLKEHVSKEGFKFALHAAIKSGDNVLGSMGVASRSGPGFQQSDLQILTSFGNQIGVAIDRARLYRKQKATAEDLRQKVNQLVILNEMGHLIRMSNRTAEAAMVVVSAIVQGIGFDRVCIWLLDEDGNNMSLAACHGLDKVLLGRKLPVSDSSLSTLPLDDGEAFFASGSVCDPAADFSQSQERAVALAPLVTRNPGNKEVRCWERFSCGEESCPAYKNPALTCWIIKDSCQRCAKPGSTLLDKMVVCRDCDVYMANRRGRHIGILCADNRTSGRPISDDDMNALNVFASSAAAILENIMLMERLVKNEHFIDSIIFNMSSGLLVTDREGRVIMINYAGAEILRCEREDLIGRDFARAYPEAGKFLEVDEAVTLSREVAIKTRDGLVPVGYSNSFLIEHEGVSDGVIVVFRDLSEIKKLHEQLREKDRFAAIGKVAAGVAHEIRNPLFGITSVAQILAREVRDATPQKALIDAMLSETSRLNTLVEDMLLYGRTMKVVPQHVDLKTLIESVLDFHMVGLKEKGLIVNLDFADDLPPLLLDPHQMRQVFLNLLMNSLDASRRGGEITLKTRVAKDAVAVKISDNGIGIPEDDLPKVFDLFYTTKEKGTGLGLAICRKIVEDHGGQISIHSLPGKGTTVEIMLPSRLAL